MLTLLAWLAVPALLIAVVDDWFLRPRRQAAQPPLPDPGFMTAMPYVLLVTLIAAVLMLIRSERLDFSLALVLVCALSGAVWLLDVLLFAPMRARMARRAAREPSSIAEPVTVDYARSFFPVAIAVLMVRSFIFEPFRIPSDSMMPTLLDGDFILVNKYDYGLRLPVINTKVLPIGEPHRGDVVVFRFPPDPAVNYIKRLVGLPGDRVRIVNDQLIINDVPVPVMSDGRYNENCYQNFRLSTELLGSHRHQTLSCLTPDEIVAPPSQRCWRHLDRTYECLEPTIPGERDHSDATDLTVVPPGQYLMIGDNRDNSYDGRYWGFVPEANLVGKATRIWLNVEYGHPGGPLKWIGWDRIGRRIE